MPPSLDNIQSPTELMDNPSSRRTKQPQTKVGIPDKRHRPTTGSAPLSYNNFAMKEEQAKPTHKKKTASAKPTKLAAPGAPAP